MCGILCGCGNLPEPYAPPAQRRLFEAPPEAARIINMSDADAENHFVHDVSPELDGNTWRWTGKRPTIRLRTGANPKLLYSIDFAIAGVHPSAHRSGHALIVRERSSSLPGPVCIAGAAPAQKTGSRRVAGAERERNARRRDRQTVDASSARRDASGLHSGGAGIWNRRGWGKNESPRGTGRCGIHRRGLLRAGI